MQELTLEDLGNQTLSVVLDYMMVSEEALVGPPLSLPPPSPSLSPSQDPTDAVSSTNECLTFSPSPVPLPASQVLTDRLGRICSVNRPWVHLCGYTLSEVEGHTSKILQGPATDRNKVAALNHDIRALRRCEATVVNYKKGGIAFTNNVRIIPIPTQAVHAQGHLGPQEQLAEHCHFVARLQAV